MPEVSTSRLVHRSIASLFVLGAVLGGSNESTKHSQIEVIRPYVSISGRVSAISERQHLLIRDQESFEAIWQAHQGERIERAGQGWPLTPTVDFESCMVVAIFSGDRVNANGERIESIEREADRLVIRYDTMTYQTASFGAPDRGEPARPYGIFVLPRVDSPVVLLENTQNIIGADPEWTERASFAAP